MEAVVKEPEKLELYHGTFGLNGDKISIWSGKGIGWNKYTLGDAFYTSVSLDAAKLFSYIILQRCRDMGYCGWPEATIAQVYKINLKSDIQLLDAQHTLDIKDVRGALVCAGISERQADQLLKGKQSLDFYQAADLLCYGLPFEMNRNEYMCLALGYDGVMVKERAWQGWEHYPDNIGVDWSVLNNPDAWPPKTVAIYDDEMVASFQMILDGRKIGNGTDRDTDWLGAGR